MLKSILTLCLLCMVSSLNAVEPQDSPETIFTPLFGPHHKERASASGLGSDLIQTAVIQEELPKLIKKLGINTIVDAPCGDFYWMKHVNLEVKSYIGVDVIRELIEQNQTNFGNKTRKFIHLDLTAESVPQADLIICRDCLVHCSQDDIRSILSHFKKSGSTYLLATSFPRTMKNININTGEWFPINLMIAPFNFPKPLLIINENCTQEGGYYNDKSLYLWKLDQIQIAVQQHIFNEPITILSQPIQSKSESKWVHPAVIRSLKRGMDLLGVDYNYNPQKIENLHENVIVLTNFQALKEAIRLKKQGKIKRLLVGPNLTFLPDELPEELQTSPEIDFCISPSDWFRDLHISQLPKLEGKFAIWPSGIDTTFWDPQEQPKNPIDVLVYHKSGTDEFCNQVEAQLRSKGWNPFRITYGEYYPDQYKNLLQKSQFAVFLSHYEMQGLALAEAWSMNVPTLVWDKGYSGYDGLYFNSSSAPYLTKATGDSWSTLDELEQLLDQIPVKLKEYSPREWTQKNMTDEVSVSLLLKIFADLKSNLTKPAPLH